MRVMVRGFGLVEVLVAVLVLATGLLGLAATMLVASRTQQHAIARTQAAWLATDLVERMQLNPVAAAQGAYDGTDYPVAASAPACDARHACAPRAWAMHDRSRWSALLRAYLSDTARAALACRHAAADTLAPGNATCTLAIHWQTPGVDARITRASWTFRP